MPARWPRSSGSSRDGAGSRARAASTRWTSPRRTASTRSAPSPRSCTRRGSGCSTCRGTCCAPAAAACSTPVPRSRPCTGKPTAARSAPPATSPRSTRWSRSLSRSARGCAASPPTIPDSLPDLGILPAGLLELRRRSARGLRAAHSRDHDRRRSSCRAGEKTTLSLQLPAEFVIVFDAGHPCRAFPRREGRADDGAPGAHGGLQADRGADRDHRAAARPAAALAREPHRQARAAGGVDRRRHASPAARPAQAVPDRQAPAHQPDVPRHLPNRHARRRSAPQDHEPHLPVHRPQGFDRALRARRRSCRLRSGEGAFPRAQRDRRRRNRRRGQDDRRRGDGHLPDARPGACRRAAHARGHARPQRPAQAAKTCCSRSASTRVRASRSCSTIARTTSGRR